MKPFVTRSIYTIYIFIEDKGAGVPGLQGVDRLSKKFASILITIKSLSGHFL